MNDPRPDEFVQFDRLLRKNAPAGFVPWYFRCEAGGKAPDISFGSWKSERARLSTDEAVEWMEDGGNVGIAGTAEDRLVNVDIDDEDETDPGDLKKTLIARSRSRVGTHAWYFRAADEEIPNIPTDAAGEVRTEWQFVVAPGSYVGTDPDAVPDDQRDNAGYYTVECAEAVAELSFDELPAVFRETHNHNEELRAEADGRMASAGFDAPDGDGTRSALFDLEARDVVAKEGGSTDTGARWSSLFHGSDTDANMALTDKGLLQCFRHNVTHNGLQALVVLSDYMANGDTACERVGNPHSNSGGSPSCMIGDDEAIWCAWQYAKTAGYIPNDDPVPYRALVHLVRGMGLAPDDSIPEEYDPENGERLPSYAYNAALSAIENRYGLDTGREKVGGGSRKTDGSERIGTGDDDDERELPTPDTLALHQGGYGWWKQHEDEEDEWIEATNFQLETNSFATDPDDPNQKQIDMTVHPSAGEAYDVIIPPTVFNEKRDFKSNVVIGLTTTFSGKESILNQLKRFVGGQDAPLRTGTYQMGRFGDEWVTPEGVLTADGWCDDPDHIHVSRDVGAERKWGLSPSGGDEYDAAEVRRMLELLPKTRDLQRFIPVLGWFYATPFKPLIHEWTGQFNLLGILGETGAGKSASLSVMWELFGMDGDPMTADDTKYVLLTTLASTNAIPMWFDEYKPSDMSDWAVDTFWNEIRKTTRGGVSARGNADGSTTEYHLTAPTVVSGEERVHGSAEERRGIYTTFKKAPTDAGSASSRAFADLVGGSAKTNGEREYFDGHELSEHALAYYQWSLGLGDDEVRDAWRNAARHVSALLADHDIEGLEDLVEQGLQTIKFGATLYRAFYDTVGGERELLSNAAIDDAILYTATNSIGGANRKSHLDVLFEVAARAARHGYLEEGTHYKFVKEGRVDEEFRLNLATGFDKIVRYAREHDVAEDLLNSKDDYHERIGDALEASDGYVVKRGQNTPPIGRAVGINVERAVESIDDFEKSMFIRNAQQDETAPTPLADVAPGYQTLTVECVSKANDTPDAFAELGVLRDATGTVDYVVWDRAEPVGLEEGETYRIDDARGGSDPDGAPQVELDGRIAHVQSISAGVGYLSLEESSGNERLGAATDGGEFDQAKPRMKELLREHGPCSEAEWMAEAQQAGIDHDAAAGATESLKNQGLIVELDGQWELTD